MRREILDRPSPVPRVPGVYAWYFVEYPEIIPTDNCHKFDGLTLLYVGISPKAPPSNGKPPSKQRLFHRIRYHHRGNAEGSTLRLTLGCLLARELGIELRRVGSGKRMTFGRGEAILSDWLENNALVAWIEYGKPWELEDYLITNYSLPLNLESNRSHPFYTTLSEIRHEARTLARLLPIC